MIKQQTRLYVFSSAVLLCTLILTAPLSVMAEEKGSKPKEPVGKALVEKKCTVCHSIERVHGADKTHSEWEQTVAKMMRYSDRIDFLNQQEREDIIYYLASRNKTKAKSEK
ncbi:MAG: hypothetical protein SD837_16565 [Candidatus Electrothrix scaldis]|nr:MAG: hypothetical protein SD837_16565 [Candidatus Electrothrix sp. GW3-3]